MSPLIVPLLYPGFGRVTEFLRPHFRITSGLLTLPANLCPFSGRRELARFSEDFGEAVGETVEAKARSTVW